jgi:hypothetical protein
MSVEFVLDALQKHNYVVVHSVEVENASGSRVPQYLKAFNSDGIGVYIAIDLDGVVRVTKKDRFVVKEIDGKRSRLPSSHTQALERMPNASGIMYECHNQLCTVMRRDDTDIESPVFELQTPTTTSIVMNGEVLGYPLIYYSEIASDPREAVERARETAEFIRSRELDKAKREVESATLSLDVLSMEMEGMIDVATTLSSRIKNHICLLQNAMGASCELSEIARSNIFVRETLERKMFESLIAITSFQKEVERATRELREERRSVSEVIERLGDHDDPKMIPLSSVEWL